TTRTPRFGSGFWPYAPGSVSTVTNGIYGAPNLALLPVGPPTVLMYQTNAIQYVGSNVTFSAFVDGDAPLTVQWYKAPSTLLAGQTSTSLLLTNLQLNDAGDYYLIANNDMGPTQGSNATLTVLSQ